MTNTPSPAAIAGALSSKVIGQEVAVRDMAVALAKKLAGIDAGNLLMIGASGTGKTTLMRAVEDFLGTDSELAKRSTLIRVHANVLAEEAESGFAGESLLQALYEKAREDLGSEASVEQVLSRIEHGIVFVDEVDKIRGRLGDTVHVPGIRAQEALLTLIENQAVAFQLPGDESRTVTVDSRGLLFVCAGAFEGLYDAVYDRVTIGRDRGSLKPVTVVKNGKVQQKTVFTLSEWLRTDDLFDYGMTPQFLSRFDAVVLLNDLVEEDLAEIFLETPDSAIHPARRYFESFDIELSLTPEAVERIALEAASYPRLGARALKEVFRRVVREYEYEPTKAAPDGKLVIDVPDVEMMLSKKKSGRPR
jgi:ATP-dependent Clp protease ATP-binding subunit ClpX